MKALIKQWIHWLKLSLIIPSEHLNSESSFTQKSEPKTSRRPRSSDWKQVTEWNGSGISYFTWKERVGENTSLLFIGQIIGP